MLGGLASILMTQWFELVLLVIIAIRRSATVGFLRLATLFVAQGFDLATFSVMVTRHGVAAEANPIVSDLFASSGMPAVIIAKLSLVVLVGALSVASSAQGRRHIWSFIGGLPLALAITAGLIGGITNAATFLASGGPR